MGEGFAPPRSLLLKEGTFGEKADRIRQDTDEALSTPWWNSLSGPSQDVVSVREGLESSQLVVPDLFKSAAASSRNAWESLKDTLTYDVWCVHRLTSLPLLSIHPTIRSLAASLTHSSHHFFSSCRAFCPCWHCCNPFSAPPFHSSPAAPPHITSPQAPLPSHTPAQPTRFPWPGTRPLCDTPPPPCHWCLCS